MKFIREAFVCKKSSIPSPLPNTQSLPVQRKAGIGLEHQRAKIDDWLKHVSKYHNYNHSHRKSAEKVTWQITQIGNSAGCLSWQWPVRRIKDEWKSDSRMIIFSFSVASMLYLELQGLAGGKKTGMSRREVRTRRMKCWIKRKSESMLVV